MKIKLNANYCFLALSLLAGLALSPRTEAADNLVGSIPRTFLCADSDQMLITYANADDDPTTGIWVGGTWYPNEIQIIVFPVQGAVNRWSPQGSPYFTWSFEGCGEPNEQTQKGIMVMRFIDATAPGWIWNDPNTWQEKQIPETRMSFVFEDGVSWACNYLEYYGVGDPRNVSNPDPFWAAIANQTWDGTEVTRVTSSSVGTSSLIGSGFSEIVFVTDFSYSGFSAIYLLDHGPGSEVIIDPDTPPTYHEASTAPGSYDGESWESDYYNPGAPGQFGWPPYRVSSDFQTAILSIVETYDLHMWWTESSGRKDDVQVDILDGDTLIGTVYVNQQTSGGQWNMLGSYDFSTGRATIRVWGPDVGEVATVCMDAVKFSPAGVSTPELSVSPTALTPSCTEGEAAGSDNLEVWNSGGGTLSYTVSEGISWLSCSPTGGTSSGEPDSVTVSYSTSSLSPGVYHGTITVTAPGASNSPRSVTVTLTVNERPELSVSPASLFPSCSIGENAPSDQFAVWNSGGQTLSYTISEGVGWLSCSPTSGTSTAEHDPVTVSYSTSSLSPGTYDGTITVTAPGAANSPRTVAVTLTVHEGPELSVTPTSLFPSCVEGENAPSDQFEVWNSGGQSLDYTISEDVGWLSCSPTGGASAGEHDVVTVSYSASGLGAGTYNGIVTVSAAGANGSPQEVAVTLTVSPRSALLMVAPTALTADGFEGDDAPNQSFHVWNSGTGTLSYSISEDVSWLSCVPTNGTSTGEQDAIALVYHTAELPPGTYNGTIMVSAPGAQNSPQMVPVTFRIAPGMMLKISITPSNTLSLNWPGDAGTWLETTTDLAGGTWTKVPNSTGASQMELTMVNHRGFYRATSPEPPILITQQPVSVAAAAGGEALFAVAATSAEPVSYQWRLQGEDLPGATSETYSVTNVQPGAVGAYEVVVSNSLGSLTSNPATLIITSPLGHLTWVPSNTFVLGSPASEMDRGEDEGPQTTVTLTRSFWMGTYEVTQAEYLDVIGSNPSHFTGDLSLPVEFLSWEDATNYCTILTAREQTAGRIPVSYVYRLPTEAEWECVCRAGTTTRFSHGDDPGYVNLPTYAWCFENSGNTTHPVGQKSPNPWGLYDMHGNVWEWCQDWYAPYPGGSVTDPQVGPGSGSLPIVRGSSYYYGGAPARSANRGAMDPPTGMRWDVGLRVVLAPAP